MNENTLKLKMCFPQRPPKEYISSEDVFDLLINESERVEVEIALRQANQNFNEIFVSTNQPINHLEELNPHFFINE